MFLLIPLILLCFYIGFMLSSLLKINLDRHAKFGHSYLNSVSPSSLFPPKLVKLQSICNCGILAQLTDDEKFTADIKSQLQHMCGVFLLRVDISNLIEHHLLPCVVHHVEHLLGLTNAFFDFDNCSGEEDKLFQTPPPDEIVLQRLFSAGHLHPALQSRQAESLYLQGIVRQLLPCLLIPPGLKRGKKVGITKSSASNGVPQVISLINQAFSSAQFHHQLPKPASKQPIHLLDHPDPDYTQVGQCARAFLIEILANHVLLPALDSIANPDSLNTVFLYLIDPIADDTDYPPNAPMVPLLNSYFNVWLKGTMKLPANMRMEALLQQPKQLANFVQYMKSVNCSSTMTVLLLMFEVVSKIETENVSPELCERLKMPLQQLLLLLQSGRVVASEDLEQHQRHDRRTSSSTGVCTDCGRAVAPLSASCLPQLLGLPPRLTTVIAQAVDSPTGGVYADPLCVARLVHMPEWTSAYKSMCMMMENIYLPAYLESPEYLGKLGEPSASPSPNHQFFLLDDVSSTFGKKSSLGTSESSLTSHFYKVPRQSSSFNDINDFLTKNNMSTDIPLTQPPVRGSNRLRLRRHLTPAPQMETTKATEEETAAQMEELDFSKWRISIPSYVSSRASSSIGGGANSRPFNSTTPATPMMMMRNLEQPDSSLSSFTTPPQGYYIIVAEREINGENVSSKVNRKYAEFYVLEQRLVEFHGSQISRRMRSRRFGAQSQHFLENMRHYFERFLRYLLTQPFLRTSELLYTFLTAPHVEFTSGNLSDIRFGKFVKSVPILLAKEKGQFTDEFLTTFRSSCFTPIHNSPNQKVATVANHQPESIYTQPSALDHRLRSNIYWNNGGIPILQKRVCSSEYCAMEGSYVTSFYDFFGYLVDNFRKPDSTKPFTTDQPVAKRPRLDSASGKFSVYEDLMQWGQRVALACWSAFKTLWREMIYALEPKGWISEYLHHPRLLSNSSTNVVRSSETKTYLPAMLRRAILNVGLVLRATQFRDLVDFHLRRQVEQFLQLLARNDYLAPMLLLLRNSIFFPSPPRSEREKADRREKVYAGLRRLMNRFHLQSFSEDDMLQRRLGRVFEVFQHGKWNKQLTYTLLDHILLELFPDVFAPSVATKPPSQ